MKEGRYSVREMTLSWPKLYALWDKLQTFRTLFSDLTRGDFGNFKAYVLSHDTLWLEIVDGERLVGLAVLQRLSRIVDAEAHVLFIDRELSDKVPVCKATIKWIFNTLPLQRLTVEIPTIYFAPVRFLNDLGFQREGRKRQAILISGKWVDIFILGLTRGEALRL